MATTPDNRPWTPHPIPQWVIKEFIRRQKDIGINAYLSGLASLSLRNYYNLKKRENRGKKTELNSANYFSIALQYITPPVVFFDDECNCIDFEGDPILRAENEKENIMQGILLGVNWGIQRHFNRKLSLDINLGPAYSTKKKELTFLTNLTLIVWLNQNKDAYW